MLLVHTKYPFLCGKDVEKIFVTTKISLSTVANKCGIILHQAII